MVTVIPNIKEEPGVELVELIVELVGLVVVLVSEASISIVSPPENPSPEVSSSAADASSTIVSEEGATKGSA